MKEQDKRKEEREQKGYIPILWTEKYTNIQVVFCIYSSLQTCSHILAEIYTLRAQNT